MVLVGADDQLGIGEQCRDVLITLVADYLRHRLRHFGFGRFALDHREGNAIDEQHDVRPRRLVAAGALHREFGGDVIDIIFWIFPVDVVECETAHRTFHRLLQRHAQCQQVIDSLVGFQQAVVLHILQPLNRALQVFLAEQVTVALVLDAVDALETVAQHLFHQHIGKSPAAHGQRLRRSQIAIAEISQQLQRGNLREVFLVELKAAHAATLLFSTDTRHWPVRSFRIRPRFCCLKALTSVCSRTISRLASSSTALISRCSSSSGRGI